MKTTFRIFLCLLLTVMMFLPCIGLVSNVVHADTSYNVGDIVEFGSYPQSLVTNDVLINKLNSINSEWFSYGYYTGNGKYDGSMVPSDYMKYRDVTVAGVNYRAIYFSKYRPSFTKYEASTTQNGSQTLQYQNEYYTNTIYWFKYEPIVWRVLDSTTGYLLSENILDAQAYNNFVVSGTGGDFWGDINKSIYTCDYAKSSIRNWLNNEFYNWAFNNSQRNKIKYTYRDNKSSFGSSWDSSGTYDKILLLTKSEALNNTYGFNTDRTVCDINRQAMGSDYAKAQGLSVYSNSSSSYIGNSDWLLGTPNTDESVNNTSYDGRVQYTWSNDCMPSNTSFGIRPAITVDLSAVSPVKSNDSNMNADTEDYIIRHTLFASYSTMPESFGFYNKIWNEENGRRLGWVKAWEVVGDIGELLSIKFDDLEISADFYDLFLSDIILKLADQKVESFKLKYFECFNQVYKPLKNVLKTTEEWTKSVESGSELDLEIESFLIDPDYNMSYGTFIRLNDILGEAFTKHSELFNDVFSGLHNISTLCEYVTDAADIVQAFKEAYKAYAITQAFRQVNEEFFTIMYQVVSRMDNKTYANWFKDAIDKYFDISNNGDAEFEFSLSLMKDMAQMLGDRVLKDAFKNCVYKGVAELLSCPSGYLAIALFTYNTTYGILDKVCKLNVKTNAYEIMNYIAPIEKALSELENDYAAILIGSQTLESAQNYDYFYNLYKEVNLYLYQAAYDYTAATFWRKDKETELEVITLCSDQWKRSTCHPGISAVTAKKYSGVFCPVDVFAYDEAGNTILEIINDEIVTCAEDITALTFDGKKSIIYPADQNYTIHIISRENGQMDYYVAEIDDSETTRQLDFYNIPLTEGQEFTGNIPQAFNIEAAAYGLQTEQTTVPCNYDSSEDDCTNHTLTDWEMIREATCIEEGEKVAFCKVCGKEVFELTALSDTHTWDEGTVTKAPTCTAAGEKTFTCTVCGETKVEPIAPLGHAYGNWTRVDDSTHRRVCANDPQHVETAAHNWDAGRQTKTPTCAARGEFTYTCRDCGATKVTYQNTVQHKDDDRDGYCDYGCGTTFTKPEEPHEEEGGKCPYCGQRHTGFFGGIVGFFHRIAYFFKNLFGGK